jgi:hypothetical protein
LHYRAIFPSNALPTPPPSNVPSAAQSVISDDDDTLALVKHYFNLGVNLGQLYEQWAAADANFKKRAPKFAGVRILRQDPWEALIGFICSSNNNISRISSMVAKTEVKEETTVVKEEENDEEVVQVSKTETVANTKVKRAPLEDEHQPVEVEEKVVRKSKRCKTKK